MGPDPIRQCALIRIHSMSSKPDLAALEEALEYSFRCPELLEKALTHSSYANEQQASEPLLDNEQLEFLGDSVLGLVTSEALFAGYPQYSEGQLSKTRAHLVSARHLVRVANRLGIGQFLRLGRGEERSGGRHKSALLVDALEAILAAIYLDSGMQNVRQFILEKIVKPELQRIETQPDAALEISDQKSALQEWLQATGRPQPSYHLIKEEGPEHQKRFTVELRITAVDGQQVVHVSRAEGATKKAAEQRAAEQALMHLHNLEGHP